MLKVTNGISNYFEDDVTGYIVRYKRYDDEASLDGQVRVDASEADLSTFTEVGC